MALVDKRLSVDEIIVGKRFRKDAGDLASLADSIGRLGLLHPIVVAPTNDLLAGWRRLEAVKLLGWTDCPVRVAIDVADLRDALHVERDENAQRKDFTITEADAMARAIEAMEKPKAKQRKAQGRPPSGSSANLAEDTEPRPRDVAAEATGLGHETLRKARAVVDAAEDETASDEVRAAAAQATKEMDDTGKVDPAFKKVMKAVSDADPTVREKTVAVTISKMHKAIAGVVADVTPEAAAALVTPEWVDFRDESSKAAIEWLTAYRTALRQPLRVVNGAAR